MRIGASIAALRYNPLWKPLENFKAEPYLKYSMGKTAYEKIWEPLMKNKLGNYSSAVSLAWFWARVYKRTESLDYPEGGFLDFARNLEDKIRKQGGKFYYETEVTKLTSKESTMLRFKKTGSLDFESEKYDVVIVTLPSFLFFKISPDLPATYINRFKKLTGIGAINLIMRLEKQFLNDGTYWLNMCDIKSPILAVVEHTNFMDKKFYNNEHIVYLGNYMPVTDERFSMKDSELLKLYDPWLKKINSNYKSSLSNFRVFKAPFAQPIITTKYSTKIPPFKTPLKKVYLTNIEQVYPWDRGTNYAVELGKKISKIILE